MKIFQILGDFCHYDATPIHPTLADTEGKYAPDIVFVEAPDYVFEGWGFDSTKEGEARFLKPIPPEGWYYDDETGQFREINPPEPEPMPDPAQELIDIASVAYTEGVNTI